MPQMNEAALRGLLGLCQRAGRSGSCAISASRTASDTGAENARSS